MLKNQRDMPPELMRMAGDESIDFALQSKRRMPAAKAMAYVIFGVVWTAFTLIMAGVFSRMGDGEMSSWFDLFPFFVLCLFVLVGIVLIGAGIYNMVSPGAFFVGTPTRVISYRNGNIKVYAWEQFNGNLEMNIQRGDLTLQLRTGTIMKKKSGAAEFVPDKIYFTGVEQVKELEEICRLRMRENESSKS